ncbi:MAG: type VII secretion protein EccB [Pseudonocardiales bacterium]|nr:MAG: type VII secretion protein EccB [Pseudonocardiales bacterium]
MRSRRDQLQAYQFLRHRIVSALLSGEPESVESPMRRIVRTSFAGLMVAVIALAVFGIIGLIKQGGANSWRAQDTIVLEKGTGALYVWKGGRLYPTLNYTSARLFLGSDVQSSVSHKSLSGVPRQPTIGITGAPGSPPSAGDLVRDPWTVCARPSGTGSQVTLLVGTPALPGTLGPGSGAVVTTGPQEIYLVWRERALPVHSPAVLDALGFRGIIPQPVGAAWKNALETGPDIGFPVVPGRGRPGPELGGQSTVVGQVFVVKGIGPDQYSVMLSSGLFAISPVVANLLLADPGAHITNRGPLSIGADVVSGAPKAPVDSLDVAGYPTQLLTPAGGPDRPVLCTTISGTTGKLTRSVHAVADLQSVTQQRVQQGGTGEVPAADFVYVQPGHGALARDGNNPTPFLIVDGRKYAIGGGDALSALGYDKVRISRLPGFFLSLLPTGPTLSRHAAGQAATFTAAPGP